MPLSHATVISLGPGGTAVGVFRRQADELVLEDFAVEPDPIAGGKTERTLDDTAASLARLRRRTTVRGEVTLVAPPQVTLIKMLQAPPVGVGRREDIVRFEAGLGIPGDPAGIVSGYVEAGARGSLPEVMLAAAKLADVEALCAAAEAAGFAPHGVVPAPVATLAAYRHVFPACSRTTLLLNVGIRSTTLLVVEAQGFFARIIPLGVLGLQGEMTGASTGISEGLNAVAIDANANLARLVQETTRTLLHLSRQGAASTPAGMLVMGYGAGVPGLVRSLGIHLNLPSERLVVHESLQIAAAARNGASGDPPMLAELTGAACLRLLPGQPEINLLPPRRSQEWRSRRRQPWLIGTGLLIVVALLPPIIHCRAVAAEATRKAAAIERAVAPVRARDAHISVAIGELARAEAQLAGLQEAWDRRGRWVEFLADLQGRLSGVGDVWLDRLRLVPGVGAAPQKVRLTGRMLDRNHPLGTVGPESIARVKALIASMHESPFVVGVEGERFDRSQPGVLTFDFVLVADPRRPL
ncbi:MAG TPA: hypothetical protein VL200_01465 [Lacunisphaera sp.]|jgi:type IV pilus assembly protein PilM|nr:hypothetical protein [Lacunisphaera sp.]